MSINAVRIAIPHPINALLSEDQELEGSVKLAVAQFARVVSDNKLVFFGEYTDHGPDHIQQVLEAASALIPEQTWKYLTPQDAAVLTLSVLIHDAGMHLSLSGFASLVMSGRNDERATYCEDDIAWPILWREYLSEAFRWDHRQLQQLFGAVTPIKVPTSDPEAWDERDKKLIGEFLRRHHARLAHEIAEFGMAGSGQRWEVFSHIPTEIAVLSGLVARSHGIPIRQATELLPLIDRAQAHGVHVTYLMAVLRIADYLQIQSDRASTTLLHVKGLRSPLSLAEWKLHATVADIKVHPYDREAIYITFKPTTLEDFIKAKRLIDDIQYELDLSWSVMGEVYGPLQYVERLEIGVRRLKTNLQEPRFKESCGFVPENTRFTCHNDLAKLLVEPLYGKQIKYAIREVLQNSVDACFTRILRDSDYAKAARVDITYSAQSNGTAILEIVDNGCGMSIDILKNYFLVAGATIRSDMAWKRRYVTNEQECLLVKTGRFGIGVLAAFLAGSRISVWTKSIDPPSQGYKLTFGLSDDYVEVRKDDCPFRTKLSIEISNADAKLHKRTLLDKDTWAWFWMTTPVISVLVNDNKGKHKIPIGSLDGLSDPPSYPWRKLRQTQVSEIYWSYDIDHSASPIPTQLVNGFVLSYDKWLPVFESSSGNAPTFLRSVDSLFRSHPNSVVLQLVDRDAKLPLTLSRDPIPWLDLGITDDLCIAMLLDRLAQILAALLGSTLQYSTVDASLSRGLSLFDWEHREGLLVYTSKGVVFNDKYSLANAGIRRRVFSTVSTGMLDIWGEDSDVGLQVESDGFKPDSYAAEVLTGGAYVYSNLSENELNLMLRNGSSEEDKWRNLVSNGAWNIYSRTEQTADQMAVEVLTRIERTLDSDKHQAVLISEWRGRPIRAVRVESTGSTPRAVSRLGFIPPNTFGPKPDQLIRRPTRSDDESTGADASNDHLHGFLLKHLPSCTIPYGNEFNSYLSKASPELRQLIDLHSERPQNLTVDALHQQPI